MATIDIDPVATAGLVTREVRSGSRDGTPTRIAVARRSYPTDQSDLWSALTDAARIPRWFLPISGDLEPGGRYQLEGNAGGTIERCEAPALLGVTWEYGEMVSWLEVTLHPDGDRTVLELVHEAPVDPEMWQQFGPGAVGVGWDLALMGLGVHLDTGAPIDPEAGAGYAVTPEGTELVRHAAHGWAEAAIADGDDATAAREAANRAVAFYTTVPEDAPEA
ncbi:SRPBCC family protein [Nocardioides caldifontis]|uniref:SRPBCC family protein n=1 Tax=Nocardioides caldifontis TaxID=2588938 RepID=UPI0011DF2248|nr:SRPBCC family protein [Nocardioides caldifontis]